MDPQLSRHSKFIAILFLQFSFDGYISFGINFSSPFPESGLPLRDSTLPLIAPLWTMAPTGDVFSGRFLYYRVTEDPTMLRLVAARITEANPNITDFNPDRAIIATWLLELANLVGQIVIYLKRLPLALRTPLLFNYSLSF